jgi:hypothetical protein
MWTLIKGSFWFSMVLVLLPVFHSGSSERLANAPPVNFTDAYSVAFGAYDYLSGLCSEKPEVCEKGGQTFTALGYRAKEGARIAYEYLNTQFSDDPAALAAARGETAAPAAATAESGVGMAATVASLAEAAVAPAGEKAEEAVAATGSAYQPLPRKPQPYRPPVADKVVTGTVPALDADGTPVADARLPAPALPSHVPVPLPRPYPES